MLLAGSALKGYAIAANDGRIGSVADVLFDDRTWRARWLVVDTGTWLTGRKVLIHPSALGKADDSARSLPVNLTMAQVQASPASYQDQPVSQQMETSLYEYYGWDPVWGSAAFAAGSMSAFPTPYPAATSSPADGAGGEAAATDGQRDEGDPNLRSIDAVTGYHIHGTDGAIGHVETFLIDDETWVIRSLVVDTRNWWPGQHVLVSPRAVRTISWPDQQVELDTTREQVKSSPPWDPAALAGRDGD